MRGESTVDFVEGGGEVFDAAFAAEGDGEGGLEGGNHCGVGGEWFSVALAVSLGRCVLPLNAYLRSGGSDGVN